ncbi:hypothetical protein QP384_33545, partial [Klebsiella pneumoniae]|uniref:hypothetical protein n=1 Tax=Klebsiella pneumoniae TaxID=573 RepID=UPI0025556132
HFQLENILLLFSIFTMFRIEWLRFPRVPSQPPQLALLGEMLFAFLFVGAPLLCVLVKGFVFVLMVL